MFHDLFLLTCVNRTTKEQHRLWPLHSASGQWDNVENIFITAINGSLVIMKCLSSVGYPVVMLTLGH